jgi:hypothetical protein
MEKSSEEMRVVRFGPFEANFTTVELRKHGMRVKLQDQPFQVRDHPGGTCPGTRSVSMGRPHTSSKFIRRGSTDTHRAV